MAEGFAELAQKAADMLPAAEQERLAEEIRKAIDHERVRRRKAFAEWLQMPSPLRGQGQLLRDVHQEFKQVLPFLRT